MMAAATLKRINATIAKINDRGFQSREQPGVWLNLSRYADPAPIIPPIGTEVELALDSSGFVREIVCTAPTSSPPPAQPATGPAPTREVVIGRLAALKSAARFLAGRPDAKSADVLMVAASWEAWATR